MRAPFRARARAVVSLLIAPVVFLTLAAATALAQHEGAVGNAPGPPAGDGTLTVEVTHASDPTHAAGLSVALYALGPDGQPGFVNGETNSEGLYQFEGISPDPRIVYLIGVKYREIPFGERFMFAEGETSARVRMKLSDPTADFADIDLRVEELRARIDWMGDRLLVREILRVTNPSDRVVLLPSNDATRSIVVRPLPRQAADFNPGPTSIGEGVGLIDQAVHFWGPLYPGEQSVEYQYTLPADSQSATLELGMHQAVGRAVIVAGTEGVVPSGAGLVASSAVLGDQGEPLSAWAKAGLAPGERFTAKFELPDTRRDPALVRVPRSDIWLEMDDTVMTARVDVQIEVEPGTPVSGSSAAPLLHVSIPTGASLEGVAPEAQALGLVPTRDGGFDVTGPIAPGSSSLGYSYKMPVGRDGVALDLKMPRDVSTLNVLIADTGLELESSRLHRRRPFRSGTRNFLHREAYNISPDETVDLTLRPLTGAGIRREAAMGLTILAAAFGAFFIFSPLRRIERPATPNEGPRERIAAEREAVYATIADLDHDFETGKLDADDHAAMRAELREQAIALLREERSHSARPEAAVANEPDGQHDSAATAAPAFCTHCGAKLEASWQFCAACGGAVQKATGKTG